MTEARSQSKKYIWIFLLVLVLGGGYAAYRYKTKGPPPPTYREVTVEEGDLKITILSTGVVAPQNRLEIKPPIPGRIERVLVQEGERVKKGQILAWMSSSERAALLDAARSKGAEEVKRWEGIYRPTPIIAPIAGMIILKSVEPGQSFTNADSVLVISDRLTVKAQVDETDLSQIKQGQTAQIVLDAYPKESIMAHVDKIAYDAKPVNNVITYVVDVVPDETPTTMRSGMTANVTFMLETREKVPLLPSEALKLNESESGGFYVLTKNPAPEGEALRREVTTGLTDGKQTEILSGLKVGETVLIQEVVMQGENDKSSPLSPFGGRRRR